MFAGLIAPPANLLRLAQCAELGALGALVALLARSVDALGVLGVAIITAWVGKSLEAMRSLAVRRHRAIENDLHWRLEVTLSEDACKVRRDHAPQNLSILRRMILNMLKIDAKANPLPKRSVRLRRKTVHPIFVAAFAACLYCKVLNRILTEG
ncbi:hypothetical protein AGMMS49545_10890 [Betaproteobacteria bacterium]|nr:hypothetical protein AGMMS49545_10890 [Betaproteobacteria bacterium]GHU44565.1 hypothetical protein AGMMS50289_13140 [Betaproteobacteria bacterium]